MRYITFQKEMKEFPVFSTREIQKHFPDFDSRRLVEWQEKGYIQKLRNRYYCFPERVDNEQSLFYTANKIYRPSYISLETALAWYGIVPETAFQMISCTSRKTQTFDTPLGRFTYRHLKNSLFFGYGLESWENHSWAIAEIEKTIIDYLYLNTNIQDISDFDALRWNTNILSETIDFEQLDKYETYINSKALSSRLNLFKEFLYA